jgi:hypothetical protein
LLAFISKANSIGSIAKYIKSISIASLLGISSPLSGSLRNRVSTIIFFFLGIYLILKFYKNIYTNYLIINTLGKLIVARFNYATNTLVSISIINLTLYSLDLKRYKTIINT